MKYIIFFATAVICFVFAFFYRKPPKVGKLQYYDGKITAIRPETRTVELLWNVDGTYYSGSYKLENEERSVTKKIHEGQSVLVMTYVGAPQIPMGFLHNNGISGRGGYSSDKIRRRLLIFGSIALLALVISVMTDS